MTTQTATNAARTERVIHNIATYRVDTDVTFSWSVEVILRVTRWTENYWSLAVVDEDGVWLRSVAICPGEFKAHEVRRYWGDRCPIVVGETRGLRAAISLAIDTLTETE